MTAALVGPGATAVEDSVTRLASPAAADARGIAQRYDKLTVVLIDGPHAGQTAEYWIPVVELEAGGTVALDAATLAALETTNGGVAIPDFAAAGVTIAVAGTFLTAWVDVRSHAGVLVTLNSTQSLQGTAEWSNDAVTVNHNYTSPFVGAGAFTIPIAARYLRLRFVNLAASPATLTTQSIGLHTAPSTFLFAVGGAIDSSFPASLVKSAITGLDPNGVYVNQAQGGTKTLSPAPSLLGASGVYTSDWFDCEAFPTVRLLIASDQISAEGGIKLQWSDTPTGVVVQTTESRSFRFGHIGLGRLLLSSTRARYLRLIYTNGLTSQGRFFLNCRLNPAPLTDLIRIESTSQGQTGQQDVTLTATTIATAALAGRRSFRLKNLIGSARAGFYGFSSGMTVLSGDELAVGEAVELDIDESVAVYVMTTSVAGAGVRFAFTEIA